VKQYFKFHVVINNILKICQQGNIPRLVYIERWKVNYIYIINNKKYVVLCQLWQMDKYMTVVKTHNLHYI
jgi:hypothetical protein